MVLLNVGEILIEKNELFIFFLIPKYGDKLKNSFGPRLSEIRLTPNE